MALSLNRKSAQTARIRDGMGIITALDQSGGSIATALTRYGVPEVDQLSDDELRREMHAFRRRIITAKSFNQRDVIGAIVFRDSVTEVLNEKPLPRYLWDNLGIVPFVKIDDGLNDKKNDIQMLRPIPDLKLRLHDMVEAGMYGTKMRSVIFAARTEQIRLIVDQQFEIAQEIIAAGLVPIIEPEVDRTSPNKYESEVILRSALKERLDELSTGQDIIFKLAIPSEDNFYDEIASHPRVLRVAALSGGLSQDDACEQLGRQSKMIASFSRALMEELRIQQGEVEFDEVLSRSISRLVEVSGRHEV